MSSTGSNKAWIGVVAGGAALIGAAVLFHYLTSGKASNTAAVYDEIDALGPAKKEANGMLAFMYYKDVFAIIQRHAKQKYAAEKK